MDEKYDALQGRRVLVVDDSTQITSLIREVLRACGAEVVTVNSGQQAMVRVQVDEFDLLLLDVKMPEADGWRILMFVRDVQPELLPHTILLTGDRYHAETLQRAGQMAVPVIYKPFDVGELRAVACALLNNVSGTLGAA
ncbi:MAG TPA: response regulator [Phycisphaerae bacterium]|nr:response regulator [Phycisphaerae bacterium]